MPLFFFGSCTPLQHVRRDAAFHDLYDRAAALFHAIICDHAFVDGNKRTGTVGAFIYLAAVENQIAATPPSPLQVRLLGEIAIETALDKLTIEQIAFWLERILGAAS